MKNFLCKVKIESPNGFFCNFIFIILAVFGFYTAICSAIYYFKMPPALYAGLFTGILYLAIWLIYKSLCKINKKSPTGAINPTGAIINIPVIFILALIPRLIVAFSINVEPFNDFWLYYDASLALADGKIEAAKAVYPFFPELQGFILWQSWIIKIVGANLINLKVINCVITSMSAVVIYLLGGHIGAYIYSKKGESPNGTGAIAGLLYAFYPSSIVFSSVLTCQHLAALLFYLSFLVLLGNENKNSNGSPTRIYEGESPVGDWRFAVCGLLIGFGQIIRPVAPPFLLAVFVFYILYKDLPLRVSKRKSPIGAKTCAIFITLACYFTVTVSCSLILYHKGLTDAPLASGDMRYKFAVGLDLNSNGGYSQEYADLFLTGNEEEKQEIFKNTIAQFIKSPIEDILLFNRKIKEIFIKPDSTLYYLIGLRMYGLEKSGNTSSGEYKNYANLDKIFKNMDYLYCLLIYLFASTGFFVFRRKNTRLLQLLALTVLFYVGIHLLIEVQPRYRYEVMPALFIFAAYGIHWICGILLNGIKSNRNPY